MRVRINIETNIPEATIEAYRALVGEPTEQALSQYILSQGYQGLEILVDEYEDLIEEAA
jgi:hypothetical protein